MNKTRKIGISTEADYITRENFASYRENGIDVFELCFEEEKLYLELDFKKVVNDANAEGVEAWSYHLPYYYFEHSIISEKDEEMRKAAVRDKSEWIKKAADAGFKYAVLHPSLEPILDIDRPFCMNSAKQSIKELSEVAKKSGMILAVENLPRTCLGKTSDEMLDLVSMAPDARFCLDINHPLLEEPSEFLRKIKDRVVTMHISDYDFVNERHWMPGEGKIDWKRVMDILDEINYNGAMIYEVPRGRLVIDTIKRERDLEPGDYRRNADELHQRLELTKLGEILV